MAKKKEENEETPVETPVEETPEEKIEEPSLTPEMKEQIKAEIAAHLKDHPPVVVEDSDDDETWKTLHEQDERIEKLETPKKKKAKRDVWDWVSIGLTALVVPLGLFFLVWDYKSTYGKWPWQKKS